MKRVLEEKSGKSSIFRVVETIGSFEINKYDVAVQGCNIFDKRYSNYLLYNSKSEVISDAYSFLNKNPRSRALNTRKNYLYGLKYFYVFLEIIEKDIKSLDRNDIFQLAAFLKGVSAKGTDFEYILLTRRSNKSINIYFSVYREYVKYLGIKKSPLLEQANYFRNIPNRSQFIGRIIKRDTTPEYISVEEYKRIMDIVKIRSDDNDSKWTKKDIRLLRNRCIIRLMFEAGLRIGEILGLTLEDLEVKQTEDGIPCPEIIVRNRLSDKEYQQAKMCSNITDVRSYMSHDYMTENLGFQLAVCIDSDGEDTYDLLCKYYRIAHKKTKKNNLVKYKNTCADSVDKFRRENKSNHYLFLNTQGGVLCDQSWNTELRMIFIEAGLHVDIGYRQHNLNHRFRHGFVMHLLYDVNFPISKIKILSRHKSDSGLEAYNNPTTDDIVKLKNEIVESIGITNTHNKGKKND